MSTKILYKNSKPLERAYLSSVSFTHNGSAQVQTEEIENYLTLGRGHENKLPLKDPFISLNHCRIDKTEKGYFLKDLRSRNGTYLNGAQIIEAKLKDLDRIQVGEIRLLFSIQKERTPSRLVGQSKNKNWNDELIKAPLMARSDLPILILGPSGSGKELLSQMLHEQSHRSMGPFVSVNCSTLTESLIESELFGHVKGSFTGANEDRKGAFEAAKGGTLFLDEIGDMPISLQPKLLRALENQEIKPVGSDKVKKIDVRIISATHKNLQELIRKSQFRSDLYYRINVLRLNPPSLKNRMEDFEDLLSLFCKQNKVVLDAQALEVLKSHHWPGNIRELKNVVMRLSASNSGDVVNEYEVQKALDIKSLEEPQNFSSLDASTHDAPATASKSSHIMEIEKNMICRALYESLGNQRKAAASIGMAKSTFHDRVKKYKINIQQYIRDLNIKDLTDK